MGEWPDTVEEILGGDLCMAFAYRTPAGGVVVIPVTTLGMFDSATGTVTTSTSLGNWKKLIRIEADNRVALAFHAREHGRATTPGYVLVQGGASFPARPDLSWGRPEVLATWAHMLPARKRGRFWDWVGREYYEKRVPIRVHVERIVAWADGDASGTPEVIGAQLPVAPPAPQTPPAKGTAARVKVRKYRSRLARARHTLVGFVGADGFPVALPARARQQGDHLEVSVAGVGLPPGGRRAGLLAHWFEERLVGQGSAILTGWLDVVDGRSSYHPHTAAGYAAPANEFAFSLFGGLAAKLGYRKAVRRGIVRDGVWVGPDGGRSARDG